MMENSYREAADPCSLLERPQRAGEWPSPTRRAHVAVVRRAGYSCRVARWLAALVAMVEPAGFGRLPATMKQLPRSLTTMD